MMHYRLYELPWEPGRDEEQRFGIIVRKAFIAFTVLAVILTYLPQPVAEIGSLPPQFAAPVLNEPQILSPLAIESPELAPVARVEPKPPGGTGRTTTTSQVTVNREIIPAVPVSRRPAAIELANRSLEEIELVFEQNKGVIKVLYNKALRRDPTLRGVLILKMTIEPSGIVSYCEIVSSEFEDAQLLRKLMERIRQFRFDEKDVAPITAIKPLDFFQV
jgi:hypothetical protein